MSTQLPPTLCDPMNCSCPGSAVHGVSQARILEWAAISSSRGSSWPRDRTCVSCIGRQILYHWAAWDGIPSVHNWCTQLGEFGDKNTLWNHHHSLHRKDTHSFKSFLVAFLLICVFVIRTLNRRSTLCKIVSVQYNINCWHHAGQSLVGFFGWPPGKSLYEVLRAPIPLPLSTMVFGVLSHLSYLVWVVLHLTFRLESKQLASLAQTRFQVVARLTVFTLHAFSNPSVSLAGDNPGTVVTIPWSFLCTQVGPECPGFWGRGHGRLVTGVFLYNCRIDDC